MLLIWAAILLGMILVPIIASYTRELEQVIEEVDKQGKEINVLKGKVKTKEDAQHLIKLLNYSVVGIFVVIALMMTIFIAGNIAPK